jgi:hypothetical protein
MLWPTALAQTGTGFPAEQHVLLRTMLSTAASKGVCSQIPAIHMITKANAPEDDAVVSSAADQAPATVSEAHSCDFSLVLIQGLQQAEVVGCIIHVDQCVTAA